MTQPTEDADWYEGCLILDELRNRGAEITPLGDRIKVDGPANILGDGLRRRMEAAKGTILSILRSASGSVPGDTPVLAQPSFGQVRLWAISHFPFASIAYNLHGGYRLNGRLDIEALRQALLAVVTRHESLRTTFTVIEGKLLQRIDSPVAVEIEITDCPESENRKSILRETEAREAARPFDLVAGPLFRVRILRLSDTEHFLLLTAHHICCDGWSIGVLFSELATYYEHFTRGTPVPVVSEFIQYRHHAAWQRRRVESGQLSQRQEYWKNRLAGERGVMELPRDFPRPAQQSFRGSWLTAALSDRLQAAIVKFSAQEHVTPFSILATAVKALLYRYTGQTDLIVGIPVSGRENNLLAKQVGFHVETLPIRTAVAGTDSFRGLLANFRQGLLEGSRNQYPLDRIMHTVGQAREPGRNPLFDVILVMQEDWFNPSFSGLATEATETHNGSSKCDLLFQFRFANGALRVEVEYDSALFSCARIGRLLKNFETLLEHALREPDAAVNSLELLARDEIQALIRLNSANVSCPADTTVVMLLASQLARTPNSPAVISRDGVMTYAALHQRAERLARYLVARGVVPDSVVGVCMNRSVHLTVAILAVLKAGAAYVPIDPRYPGDRVAFMIEDSWIAVVLVDSASAQIVGTSAAQILRVDGDLPELPIPQDPPAPTPSSLVYVLFTSGSTGRPKAVAIEHHSVVALLGWAHSTYTRPQLAGVLASTSMSFDLSVFELFLPLTCGGAVVLVENLFELESFPRRDAVTLINTVPSLMRELLKQWPTFGGNFVVNLAGEPLAQDLVDRLYEQCGVAQVYDLYGPTEDTVYSTWTLRNFLGRTSIGRPLPGKQVWIVDDRLRPVPVGVDGEILIGGHGLARGYLNRAELTAQRFVTIEPPGGEPTRVYRTGDLGRLTEQGDIEYIGRIDNQVKIRGNRIELGEVELTIASHPKVDRCVVVPHSRSKAKTDLVAYVVGREAIDSQLLRNHCRQKLPESMVPTSFVCLDSLPLTSNGKLDRKRLPPPIWTESRPQAQPAQTPLQETVHLVWKEVLEISEVGLDDNFFDCGGHSLNAIQVALRIQRRLNVQLSIADVFSHPTVRKLAELVGRRTSDLPQIGTAAEAADYPLSDQQRGLWAKYQLNPNSAAYNMHAAYTLRGRLDPDALQTAFNELVRRHSILRTIYPLVAGEPRQRILPDARGEFLRLDWRGKKNAVTAVRKHFAQERQHYFRIDRLVPIRTVLIQLSENRWWLSVTVHHIAADGWSMRILASEIESIYRALLEGRSDDRGQTVLRYRDYAVWQQGIRNAEAGRQAADYWAQRLAGESERSLLVSKGRPNRQRDCRVGICSICLRDDELRRLKKTAVAVEATIFMAVVAAVDVLIYRYTGATSIVVGSFFSGRRQSQVANEIGLFVRGLPLYGTLEGKMSFSEVLQSVRNTVVKVSEFEETPPDEIKAGMPRLGASWFNVVVTMEEAWTSPCLPDVNLEAWKSPAPYVKHDIAFRVHCRDDQCEIQIEYDPRLFSKDQVARLASHLSSIISSATEAPQSPISRLPMIGEIERRQLIATAGIRHPDNLNDGHDRQTQVPVQEELAKLSLGAGDVVLVQAGPPEQVVGVLQALQRSQTTYLPYDRSLTGEQQKALVRTYSPKAIIEMEKASGGPAQTDSFANHLPRFRVRASDSTATP